MCFLIRLSVTIICFFVYIMCNTDITHIKGELPRDRSFDGNDLTPLLYKLGEFRSLYRELSDSGATSASSSWLNRKSMLDRFWFRSGALLIQEGGGFTALRLGNYKVNYTSLSLSLFIVFVLFVD
jgi:hypothetical protein